MHIYIYGHCELNSEISVDSMVEYGAGIEGWVRVQWGKGAWGDKILVFFWVENDYWKRVSKIE